MSPLGRWRRPRRLEGPKAPSHRRPPLRGVRCVLKRCVYIRCKTAERTHSLPVSDVLSKLKLNVPGQTSMAIMCWIVNYQEKMLYFYKLNQRYQMSGFGPGSALRDDCCWCSVQAQAKRGWSNIHGLCVELWVIKKECYIFINSTKGIKWVASDLNQR